MGKGARGVNKFALMVSAVRASSWRFRGRGARARTFEATASLQLKRHEGGAFGERFERPWGKQWAEGPEVSVNLHWWSRRSALQVGDFEAAGRGHGPVSSLQPEQSSFTTAVQFASTSSVPAGEVSVQASEIQYMQHGSHRFRFAKQYCAVDHPCMHPEKEGDATNNKQQQPFFSYLPSTSSGSFISVAVAGSGTFAASHSERGAIEREAFESFLEPVAGGCLASC